MLRVLFLGGVVLAAGCEVKQPGQGTWGPVDRASVEGGSRVRLANPETEATALFAFGARAYWNGKNRNGDYTWFSASFGPDSAESLVPGKRIALDWLPIEPDSGGEGGPRSLVLTASSKNCRTETSPKLPRAGVALGDSVREVLLWSTCDGKAEVFGSKKGAAIATGTFQKDEHAVVVIRGPNAAAVRLARSATALASQARVEEARMLAEEAAAADPTWAPLLYDLAQLREAAADAEGAARAYEDYLLLRPSAANAETIRWRITRIRNSEPSNKAGDEMFNAAMHAVEGDKPGTDGAFDGFEALKGTSPLKRRWLASFHEKRKQYRQAVDALQSYLPVASPEDRASCEQLIAELGKRTEGK